MTRSPLLIASLALCLALAGCGGRTIGKTIDDQSTPSKVRAKVEAASPDLKTNSRVVVASYNGIVLLAGQTPRADLKELAGQAAQSAQGVRRVHNELQVTQPASALAILNDSTITTKITTQLLADSKVPSSQIKVITENGIVYLLGLVTRQEAQLATSIVQGVSGVQKIVRLFEYTN
ncbi:BON domain-containing protein [Metapseudomonas furukawaii]|jgi:osmotically-inducible protein OsmY|uniref:21 kDa hemolysin n=1 Tax=Metapseudomonas furukawaii TaxID=1149133 RepID=A0AAD1BYF4_METFU|nr:MULTISPECIES: BON domain-containing protein [Pseudomonas]ELS24374.1 21 kDa hemolysin precursor [Pseudomonas furukawaii]OWJ94067.1 BON domain-containing protein [Pseudomonas sp. A46]WAG80053.1 BON domain-containing protein [Pseudomonas furukawaii]BAU72678.1 21 kDa hemolysin precursor [Pseudomonas furukawaii]